MDTPRKRAFGVTYTLSALSACAAETVTFPLDIIKTRLQAQGERAGAGSGTAAAAASQQRGMVATLTGIVREEGVVRVYRGLAPACLRHCVYSGIRVGVYEVLREKVFLREPDGSFPLWKVYCNFMRAAYGPHPPPSSCYIVLRNSRSVLSWFQR